MNNHEIDRCSPSRWLQPDPTLAVFQKLSHVDGSVVAMTAEDWFEVWQHATIDSPVPADIINLFEQARACLAYGYFFYPLYALGIEQLLRVADAALMVKCDALGASAKTFEKRIDWLAARGDRPSFDPEHWHGLRKFRNESSHHSRRMLLTPATAMQFLGDVARAIEALFTPDAAGCSATAIFGASSRAGGASGVEDVPQSAHRPVEPAAGVTCCSGDLRARLVSAVA
jgi:hypothetical protein